MSFYEFLRSAPYIRLLLPFIIGILSGYFLKTSFSQYWYCFLLVTIFVALVLNILKTYKTLWLWGVLLHLFIAVAGYTLSNFSVKQPFFTENEVVAKGIVIENPLKKPGTYSTLVKIEALKENGVWKARNEKILVSLQKGLKHAPELNQIILFKGKLKEIRNFGNPYEFDYKTYMNRAGIYYRAYIDSGNWFITGENSTFNIFIKALQWRNKILNYFRQLNFDQPSFAVIAALTVGDKSYLDQELKSTYVNSGTIHILAVSGMHVGLLFWLLQQITTPLMLWRRGKIARTAVVLLVIWIYAMITGLTPSVVRASVMFTFWMLGEAGERKVSIYNTISASALFLLIINPQAIFDVGFQLSYMAVLGIVIFYKDIYNWFFFKNWFLKQGWSMVAVSLAAQLLTLPLTLYYFHQFPNYFLLANIVALPLSTFILYGSIAALLIAPIKFLWLPVAWILKWMVFAMNYVLNWVEHLPGAVTTGIPATVLMAVMVLLIVVAGRLFIYNRKAIYLHIILLCCIAMACETLVRNYRICKSDDLIVYNSPGSLVIQMREGFKSSVLTNNSSYNIGKLIKPYCEAYKIKDYKRINLLKDTCLNDRKILFHRNFLVLGNQKVYIWNRNFQLNRRVDVDLLIINKFRLKDTSEVRKYFNPHQILITSDVFGPVAAQLKDYFLSGNIPCKALNTDGYWTFQPIKKIDK